jgi:hypothetical protein
MSILEWCQRIQEMWLSRTIAETTWGYPIAGALHVLAIALFGGAVLAPRLSVVESEDVRWVRRIGLTLAVTTGALVFASGAVAYYGSASFRIKIALLVLLAVNGMASSREHHRKRHSIISLALWAAVIFASRGIAFF